LGFSNLRHANWSSHRLEDEIEGLADAVEILSGIVDGAVRAEGFDLN
jgi:hypothetical protein